MKQSVEAQVQAEILQRRKIMSKQGEAAEDHQARKKEEEATMEKTIKKEFEGVELPRSRKREREVAEEKETESEELGNKDGMDERTSAVQDEADEDREEVVVKKGVMEEWVGSLLEAEFYVQCGCGATTKGETNMFCTECLGKAFCERCRNGGGRHKNHKVIQVYKSSHATCFRKHDIKKLMDISQIQSFINNSYHVIYIRPRKSNGHRNGGQPINRCKICEWELKSENELYCSISCKVEDLKVKRCRKRSCKGIPHRAPFF